MAINKNSNAYIIIYTIVMVVIVGSLLAFLATSLKDKQAANILNEQKANILKAFGDKSDVKEFGKLVKVGLIKNGNEFHNSTAVEKEYKETPWRGNFFWKIFLNAYVAYVGNQERMTPRFQRFIKVVQGKYGTDIPDSLRKEFRKGSLPLMKYTNILTFNSRAITLCFTMIIGHLWFYLFFELVILMVLFIYTQQKHERLCKRLTKKIENEHEYN